LAFEIVSQKIQSLHVLVVENLSIGLCVIDFRNARKMDIFLSLVFIPQTVISMLQKSAQLEYWILREVDCIGVLSVRYPN
jgi:hypothetical protein